MCVGAHVSIIDDDKCIDKNLMKCAFTGSLSLSLPARERDNVLFHFLFLFYSILVQVLLGWAGPLWEDEVCYCGFVLLSA